MHVVDYIRKSNWAIDAAVAAAPKNVNKYNRKGAGSCCHQVVLNVRGFLKYLRSLPIYSQGEDELLYRACQGPRVRQTNLGCG